MVIETVVVGLQMCCKQFLSPAHVPCFKFPVVAVKVFPNSLCRLESGYLRRKNQQRPLKTNWAMRPPISEGTMESGRPFDGFPQ